MFRHTLLHPRRGGTRLALLLAALLVSAAPSLSCSDGEPIEQPQVDGARVVETSPPDGASDVAIDAEIEVVFDREMDGDTMTTETVMLEPATAGSFSWDGPSRTMTFRPRGGLLPETTYTVRITGGVRDEEGQRLAEEHSFSFTTAGGDGSTNGIYRADNQTVRVGVEQLDGERRRYAMSTTASLRDNDPADGQVVFEERAGSMWLRSGDVVFDALFALSIEELHQNSVSSISDGAFNNGQGVPCECFETGAKWNYVWTRDTAYAAQLGLALFDPIRTKNSLDFKLSQDKAGGNLQIVQDTGSGGSWPVSTDRVVWALGARQTLALLHGPEREAWRDRALEAMANTIELDRRVVYDATDGLYRGEQSFLDWREQSYPSYTADDTVHLAMSKALSTNVGHLAVLQLAADLAEEVGDTERAERWAGWATELARAINDEMFLEDAGMYATMKPTGLDPAPLHKYDLLGLSLAVLEGVATGPRATSVVANYPHVAKGPPVLWPQQPMVPIYHNRGIWPFVTAYGLLAARQVGNAAVFDHDLESLIRGAALNLSNMENFEFLTQHPWVDDGDYSGPVVNSRRQLWSVAGYLGAIAHGVFGIELDQRSFRVQPFVTAEMRRGWFGATDAVWLRGVPYRGRTLDIGIVLPRVLPEGATGALPISSVSFNRLAFPADGWISADRLKEGRNEILVTLAAPEGAADAGAINLIEDDGDWRTFWAPREPVLQAVEQSDDGQLTVRFEGHGEEGVRFNVFRDGVQVASDLEAGSWTDPDSGDASSRTYCYAVEAVFTVSGNRSHHSQPQCWWGTGEASRVQEISIHGFREQGGGSWSEMHGRPHYENWGDVGDVLELVGFRPAWSGEHLLQLVYGNGAGGFNTGITAAVKEVVIEEVDSGQAVGGGYFVMPQLGAWERWGASSFVEVTLEADKIYRVLIRDGFNMSYLEHFRPYTGGTGGGDERFNRVNITAMKVLPIAGTPPAAAAPAVSLDGVDDLGAFAAEQQIVPGAPLESWDRFALSWDDRYLYVVLTSPAFEDPYRPLMLYLQAGRDQIGAAGTGNQGMEYSGLTPRLPFDAGWAIGARQLSWDGSDADGPFNGVWRRSGESWERTRRLEQGVDWWLSDDNHTLALRIDRAWLGGADWLRLAGHVVHGGAGNEWKDLVPAAHMPWMSAQTGYLEIDLRGAKPAGNWQVR